MPSPPSTWIPTSSFLAIDIRPFAPMPPPTLESLKSPDVGLVEPVSVQSTAGAVTVGGCGCVPSPGNCSVIAPCAAKHGYTRSRIVLTDPEDLEVPEVLDREPPGTQSPASCCMHKVPVWVIQASASRPVGPTRKLLHVVLVVTGNSHGGNAIGNGNRAGGRGWQRCRRVPVNRQSQRSTLPPQPPASTLRLRRTSSRRGVLLAAPSWKPTVVLQGRLPTAVLPFDCPCLSSFP